MAGTDNLFATIPPIAWALVGLALILGILIGRLIWGRALARQEQVAFELAQARANVDQAGTHRQQLERDLAASRDQIRPLADEVERLRRENARLQSAAAAAPAVAAAPAAAVDGRAPGRDLNDLRLLKGVGDKMLARLEDLHIRSNADLAALTPTEAARVDAGLGPFEGRLARDQLIEQARLLVDGRVAEYEARFGRLSA